MTRAPVRVSAPILKLATVEAHAWIVTAVEKEAAARRATDAQVLEDAERLIAAWNGPTPRPGCSVPSNRSFETGMETGVSVSVFVVRRRIYKMKNRCPFWG